MSSPLRRVGCILLILWQVFCLNVFLPAHTRGAMTVGKTCCAESPKRQSNDKPTPPTPEERSRCSVCYFAAGLSTPPVVDLSLLPLGLAEILDPPAPSTSVSIRATLQLRDRAPPVMI